MLSLGSQSYFPRPQGPHIMVVRCPLYPNLLGRIWVFRKGDLWRPTCSWVRIRNERKASDVCLVLFSVITRGCDTIRVRIHTLKRELEIGCGFFDIGNLQFERVLVIILPLPKDSSRQTDVLIWKKGNTVLLFVSIESYSTMLSPEKTGGQDDRPHYSCSLWDWSLSQRKSCTVSVWRTKVYVRDGERVTLFRMTETRTKECTFYLFTIVSEIS